MSEDEYRLKTNDELVKEIVELQSRLDEAEDTLKAIQNGEIDAIVTPDGSDGAHVYTLEGADYLYRNLVEEMGEGVATLTKDGTIFYSNAQLADMLQVPLERITGQKLDSYVLPEDQGLFKAIFENAFETNSKGEISLKTVDGTIIPVHISINTLTDLNGVYIVITDLSEQKHHEELKMAQEQLEKSFAEVKRSNYELQRFAYVAAHDLQEPLRMVNIFSQLLEQRYKDNLDDKADEYIGFIVDGAHNMKQLIDDLLAYSRITTHAKEFEPVNLGKILDTVLTNLSVSIEENQVKIQHNTLPTLQADPSQIGQIFQNLIANAIKFHGEDDPVIEINAQKDGDEWIFAIKDNGIGIDPEHQEQIFDVFRRLHTREDYPGTGIGLSICQKIIKRHGGRLWVESEVGKGSTFYFTLPETI